MALNRLDHLFRTVHTVFTPHVDDDDPQCFCRSFFQFSIADSQGAIDQKNIFTLIEPFFLLNKYLGYNS